MKALSPLDIFPNADIAYLQPYTVVETSHEYEGNALLTLPASVILYDSEAHQKRSPVWSIGLRDQPRQFFIFAYDGATRQERLFVREDPDELLLASCKRLGITIENLLVERDTDSEEGVDGFIE